MLAQVCAEQPWRRKDRRNRLPTRRDQPVGGAKCGQAVAALGLMNGMEDGTFAPQDAALREQAIVVLQRLRKLDGKYIKKFFQKRRILPCTCRK